MNIKILFFSLFGFTSTLINTFASGAPKIYCAEWMPWCKKDLKVDSTNALNIWDNLISTAIQYVAVFAVLALAYGWVQYLLAAGEEEKAKKAKTTITWSLIGVLVSTGAWMIVNIVTSLKLW